MAADVKIKYGTEAQALTITLASLANNGARQSTVIDNTGNLFLDALLVVKIKSAAASVSSSGYVNIYAFGTVDIAGGVYPEGAGASDAGITLVSPTNLRLIGVLNMVANAVTYIGMMSSIASAFGGVLPEKWGIVVENKSGAAFDSTGGNHSIEYQGIYGQTT